MSTYRTRWSDEYRHAPYRAWWSRVPRRQRTIVVTLIMLAGFVVASWGDGPYEQPVHTPPADCWRDPVWGC